MGVRLCGSVHSLPRLCIEVTFHRIQAASPQEREQSVPMGKWTGFLSLLVDVTLYFTLRERSS
jgi:hypothetical protein